MEVRPADGGLTGRHRTPIYLALRCQPVSWSRVSTLDFIGARKRYVKGLVKSLPFGGRCCLRCGDLDAQ